MTLAPCFLASRPSDSDSIPLRSAKPVGGSCTSCSGTVSQPYRHESGWNLNIIYAWIHEADTDTRDGQPRRLADGVYVEHLVVERRGSKATGSIPGLTTALPFLLIPPSASSGSLVHHRLHGLRDEAAWNCHAEAASGPSACSKSPGRRWAAKPNGSGCRQIDLLAENSESGRWPRDVLWSL